ncbi:MAG: hypothetical protein GX076_04665 [Clostridiales bacterium]|nr:hypothetical protein [Clostridiales bacterium]
MENLKMKRVLVVIAIIVMTTSVVFAAPVITDSVNVVLQGKEADFGDKGVYLEDGHIYVPFRQFFESIGYDVDWDAASNTAVAKDPLRISSYVDREQKVDAALWQLSAEARACFIQAFNLATLRFDQALEKYPDATNLAVIADIDDTLVDGVMYTADVLQDGEWTNDAFGRSLASEACKPLPGAVEFMNYVVDNGGHVFYITNRVSSLREVTFETMEKMGFPMVDEDHIFIREDGMASSKESRRNIVEKDYEVVMILGDNLEDFADLFPPSEGVQARRDAVDEVYDMWGDKFIILPNAVYGDWEKAVYNYDRSKTLEERMQDKKAIFDYYKYTR